MRGERRNNKIKMKIIILGLMGLLTLAFSSVPDIHKQIPNNVDDIIHIALPIVLTYKVDRFLGGRSV